MSEAKPLLQRHVSKPVAAAPLPDMARAKPVEPVSMTLRHAFAVERCPGGWQFITVKYRDDGTIETIERSEPNIKPVVLESFKIAALKYWTSIG